MHVMARIWITGSSDGIGQASAKLLADQGHKVFLHARNEQRAEDARKAVPNAVGMVVGDLGSIDGTKKLAEEANRHGPFDAIIHNAGLGLTSGSDRTSDGLVPVFVVNTLGPYILTCLMPKPKRLLYLSSSAHRSGHDSLDDVNWDKRTWDGYSAYCETKLHDVMLANAVARDWPDVQSCSMDPGWIKTKMAGAMATGRVSTPAKAIADFATGHLSPAGVKTGVYFTPQGVQAPKESADDEARQGELLKICEKLSGETFPG